jgi:hypothetical protein
VDRFVKPESIRLPLPDGDWIQVKVRLNAGEYRAFIMQSSKATTAPCPSCGFQSDDLVFDALKYPVELAAAYLLDWSFTMNGQVVPIAQQSGEVIRSALDNLEPEDFKLVWQAIEAHKDRQDLARAQEKKRQASATSSAPTLLSPGAAVGVMNGLPD